MHNEQDEEHIVRNSLYEVVLVLSTSMGKRTEMRGYFEKRISNRTKIGTQAVWF